MGYKDITSKNILKAIVLDMARYLLDMPLDSAELLDTETQRVEDRRADLVVKAQQNKKEFILHLEVQNNNQSNMPLRMLRYYTDIALNWPGYEVIQYLVYIGKAPLAMPSGINRKKHFYQYHTIDMQQIDCSVFLKQNDPRAVLLAILCDFKDRDKRRLVRQILQRIAVLTQQDESHYRECVLMLEILSQNRDLTTLVKEEESMISDFKLEELPSYEIGWEKGIQKGIEKGIEKSQMEIILKAHAAGLNIAMISQITGLSEQEVRKICN